MPRKARLNVPGAIYHVMSRCLDYYVLFNDDKDSELFLSLIERYLVQAGALCYVWALMKNHYHLVLRMGEVELGRIMKPLNMHYAYYHRKKYPGLSVEEMKMRHRGNTISMARMVFAHSADRYYQTPHRLIAEFLNVGATAISEMSRKGGVIMEERGGLK